MPTDHTGARTFIDQATRDANKRLLADLTHPTREALKMQNTGADIAKQVSEMIMGPARDGIRSQYSGIDMSGARAAIDAAMPKIDMSQFLATHQQKIDTSQFLKRTYTASTPLKNFMNEISENINSQLAVDSVTRRGSGVSLAERIEEIQKATAPEVVQEFKIDVVTPVADQVLDDLATEPSDADVAVVESLVEGVTPEMEDLADLVLELDPGFKEKCLAAVATLKEKLSWVTDRALLAVVTALALGAVAYWTILVCAPEDVMVSAVDFAAFAGLFVAIAGVLLLMGKKK